MDNRSESMPWARASIEQNRRWLLAYVLAATGDLHTAEDIVQSTFETAYRKLSEYKAGTPFGVWLRGIARNYLKKEWERKRLGPHPLGSGAMAELEQSAADMESKLLDPECREERFSALRHCLQALPAKARKILQLRYDRDLNLNEIARTVSVNPNNLGVMLFRARQALFDCISKRTAI
ncbi:RNA polymerase sigma factor [Planctomycetota bacterium]